ncbi:MAG: LytR C-terminal domain-containing protein, partial [Candidatus Saccharibacteria bacterium]|nr:LytR C-terminal domain-containing protein [Candidatus Saccharibacteria bacterium]
QKILIGIKDRVFEKELSITDLVSLASTLGDNLRTNFSVSELKSAAHLTASFDFESMRQVSLWPDYMTTSNINGISYVIPRAGANNYGKIQTYVDTMLSNNPRVYEEPTVLVLNATETYGLAGTEQTKLIEEGYQNVTADNAPVGEYNQGYTIYATTEAKPGTRALLESYYNVTAETNIPDNISKNYDFIIILNPLVGTEE